MESINDRITEWLRFLGRDLWAFWAKPCPSKTTLSRMHRPTSRLLSQMPEEETPQALWTALCQCYIMLTAEKYFVEFRWNLLCSHLCPVPPDLVLVTTKQSLTPSFLHPPFKPLIHQNPQVLLQRAAVNEFFSKLEHKSTNAQDHRNAQAWSALAEILLSVSDHLFISYMP